MKPQLLRTGSWIRMKSPLACMNCLSGTPYSGGRSAPGQPYLGCVVRCSSVRDGIAGTGAVWRRAVITRRWHHVHAIVQMGLSSNGRVNTLIAGVSRRGSRRGVIIRVGAVTMRGSLREIAIVVGAVTA